MLRRVKGVWVLGGLGDLGFRTLEFNWDFLGLRF